jgi:hypothetical protein
MTPMSRRGRIVVVVCIAVVAFTATVTMPMLALLDAQTPIDALFWSPASAPAPAIEDIAIPASPIVDVQSPRAPPLA